ncbi:MAG: protein translocase subunit SecDF [Rikenellaceae bacterium]|nr:protein translocase subunit SecDF [Rikenellaceae bacterium]
MQNKGALKLLVVLLVIACAYQLSFTFVTRSVEKKAARYAEGFPVELRGEKEQSYLDSMKTQTVYNLWIIKYNYRECKEKEINLGLDLKGGMNVILEIAVEDVVVALSNHSKDADFEAAIARAKELEKSSSEDFITLFARSYNEISGGKPLANIFNTPDLRSEIRPTSTDAEVIGVLRRQTNDAISSSYNVLRNRIDRFGVTQPNIQQIEGSGRILVELPGVKEPERVRKLLQGTASLEFWSVYDNRDIIGMLDQANTLIRGIETTAEIEGTPAVEETAQEVLAEEAGGLAAEGRVEESNELLSAIQQQRDSLSAPLPALARDPLFEKLRPVTDESGMPYSSPVIGTAFSYDTTAVMNYLRMPQVRALLPRDIKFMWGVKPMIDENKRETNVYQLYGIKANTRDGLPPLDGGAIASSRPQYVQNGSTAEVHMNMNGEGTTKWARLTADNVGGFIAIVLDGYVYSAPRVNQEITGGSSQITGGFTFQEATDLSNVLKSGKLPAPARIIQDTVVGPSLGQESINSSMISFLLAFILVLLYMILFYSGAGVVACVALIANLYLLFGVLASFGAVLTLPGIAGIVLTMGMAVDANVIIYERIKEELRAGKGLAAAIQAGYRNATSAILDSNITTMITAVVLFMFGVGPVRGFATTLIIGILTSLFCAFVITRMILEWRVARGKNVKFSTRFTENFLTNTKVDFLRIRKISYLISGILILISAGFLATKGLNYGVDFTGGRSYVVRFDHDVTADEVRGAIEEVFAEAPGDDAEKSISVVQYGDANQMRIVTQYRADDDAEEATEEVEHLIYEALSPLYDTPITEAGFSTTATDPNGIISADKVGASIAHETIRNSFIAVFFSLLAIGIYVMLRFKRWQWGAGSVIALAHDAFLTIGLFSVFYGILPFTLEVDQSFIAAILTIIGYSINDKVVIFDRIREYHQLYPKRSVRENINNAINSTLSRTINTSGTTFVTLLAIFLFGGEVIRGFIFALMFGIVVGTLSSIFTATPLAYDLMKRSGEKEETKK